MLWTAYHVTLSAEMRVDNGIQAYLIFQGIEFYIVPANNHASFPGTLPTLTTHPDAGPPFVQPVISADGLMKWVRKSEALSNREEAYLTLVDGPVRRAWVSPIYPPISTVMSMLGS